MMEKKIIEYLGIEQEFINEEVNRVAINEAKEIEEKYRSQLENNIYHYAFDEDITRCYNRQKENIVIIEKLNYITVFEVIGK